MEPLPRPFRVLVADDLSERGVEILRRTPSVEVDVRVGLTPAALRAAIAPYHALLVRSATKVTSDVLEAAPELRLVGRAGIGVDNVDVPAASRRGVVVMNTPSGNAVTTAEHAICLLCALVRHVPQATASMKAGRWEKKKFQGTELFEKTLGVMGLGNIGRIVADRARGLHLKVIAHDPFVTEESATALGVELVALEELYRRADFITVHTPLLPETRGLVGQPAFRAMKHGVFLVNAARGGIVDETALLEALREGKVAGAALDVFASEPPVGSPLLALDSVICTPHLGASTEEAQEKVAIELAEQIALLLDKGEVRNPVNLAPIKREHLGRLAPWIDLSTRLGAFLGQILPGEGALREVEIEVAGEAGDLGATPVASAALAGLLRRALDQPVNEVNAKMIAAERGIRPIEIKRARGENFVSSVAVRARGRDWERAVKGSVFHVGDNPEPRLVQVDGFLLEVAPEGRILLIRNEDRPGVIGAVGTLLGGRGVNVSRMQVGLDRGRGEALMLWNVDGPVDALLPEIRRLPHVRAASEVVL